MNGTAPEPLPGIGLAEIQRLQSSFRVFNQVTRSLEEAYRRLEGRSAAVDDRLKGANSRLKDRVNELNRVSGELNGILDAIPCGVVASDGFGTVTRVNAAAERILGRPASELVGRDVRALVGGRGEPILALGRVEARTGVVVERKVCCLDGAVRFLSGSVAELPDGGRIEVLTDQTEVAHLRAQVNRLDTLAELGEMAAGVAHEIRNPMSGVEGFAGLLEKALRGGERPDESQLLRYATRIRQGVSEVNGIIKNLLLWASPGRVQLAELRLDGIVQESLSEVAGGDEAVRGRFELDAAGEMRVRGDRLKLKLALGNLLRNAVEAAGPLGHVRVSVQPSGRRATIAVEDDGPGIAAEVRLRLFRPFATTKPSGTGLGLAIARRLVELHGGEITAEDLPERGARFAIHLPLAAAEIPA